MKAIDCLLEGYRVEQGRDGEFFSMVEQERYESAMIEEAREIVAGKSLKLSTVEHLRVLLNWLDGSDGTGKSIAAQQNQDAPF